MCQFRCSQNRHKNQLDVSFLASDTLVRIIFGAMLYLLVAKINAFSSSWHGMAIVSKEKRATMFKHWFLKCFRFENWNGARLKEKLVFCGCECETQIVFIVFIVLLLCHEPKFRRHRTMHISIYPLNCCIYAQCMCIVQCALFSSDTDLFLCCSVEMWILSRFLLHISLSFVDALFLQLLCEHSSTRSK